MAEKFSVLIRYRDTATTLPTVLAALAAQSVQPEQIIAVNTGSHDGSTALLKAAGAQVIDWAGAYHPAKVLNYGMAHCTGANVLVLSAHTVLADTDILEAYQTVLAEPRVACVSLRWDEDPFYGDTLTWEALQRKGLKSGSFYSNSMGCLRRSVWAEQPFDTRYFSMEDWAWTVNALRRGYTARRIQGRFHYLRSGKTRRYSHTVCTLRLAKETGLRPVWLGVRGCLVGMARAAGPALRGDPAMREELRVCRDRLAARVLYRFYDTQPKNR